MKQASALRENSTLSISLNIKINGKRNVYV